MFIKAWKKEIRFRFPYSQNKLSNLGYFFSALDWSNLLSTKESFLQK